MHAHQTIACSNFSKMSTAAFLTSVSQLVPQIYPVHTRCNRISSLTADEYCLTPVNNAILIDSDYWFTESCNVFTFPFHFSLSWMITWQILLCSFTVCDANLVNSSAHMHIEFSKKINSGNFQAQKHLKIILVVTEVSHFWRNETHLWL